MSKNKPVPPNRESIILSRLAEKPCTVKDLHDISNNPSEYISRLRKNGHCIFTRWRRVKNELNEFQRFAEYHLIACAE